MLLCVLRLSVLCASSVKPPLNSMLNHAFKNRSCTNRTLLLLLFVCFVSSCHSSTDANSSAGVIVVSAPAAGVVRRVLVSEGAKVEAGTPIVEIAVQTDAPVTA